MLGKFRFNNEVAKMFSNSGGRVARLGRHVVGANMMDTFREDLNKSMGGEGRSGAALRVLPGPLLTTHILDLFNTGTCGL